MLRILLLISLVACGHRHDGDSFADGGGGGGGDGGGAVVLPDPCVGYTGIQQGPWPMAARCPSRAGQAAVNGPHASASAWHHASAGRSGGSVAIALDATIYVPDLDLHALDPSGLEKWFFAIGSTVGSP